MFLQDRPIIKPDEDLLVRKGFAEHLANSIREWDGQDSLVISLDGEWGSGKSSVINMAVHYLRLQTESTPFIFEYNPWAFSDTGSITGSFFNELAKETQLKDTGEQDKELAEKLQAYAVLLGGTPEKSTLKDLFEKIIPILSLAGISLGTFPFITSQWGKLASLMFGFVFLAIQVIKDTLLKGSSYFEARSKINEKPLNKLKQEIKDKLLKNSKKLIIIIDDIDRLSQSEIKSLMKVIRVNADFPNTIYMLAMDRDIVEKNLNDEHGFSGKNYMDKIVQINFNMPQVRQSRLHKTLFLEMDRIFAHIPNEEKGKYFGENNYNWSILYNSGFKGLFKTIRDIKRYLSSFQFNLTLLYKDNTLEVNLVDFIGIEAIRVFAPKFYDFIKFNKELFTSTNNSRMLSSYDDSERQRLLKAEFSTIDLHYRKNIEDITIFLFPQLKNILERGSLSYGPEWQSKWAKELKVCSSRHFESFFAFIPGGDEEEISTYEMKKILNASQNLIEFELILNLYTTNGKIRKVLRDMQNYTDSFDDIPAENTVIIILALFNISDGLPQVQDSVLDFKPDMNVSRIIHQLFERQKERQEHNFEILKSTIIGSKTLYAPVKYISLLSPTENTSINHERIFDSSYIQSLQKLCVKKISEYDENSKLLNEVKLEYILYRWKEWDTEQSWVSFINKTVSNISTLVHFTKRFYRTIGSLNQLDVTSLSKFIELESVFSKLNAEKQQDTLEYRENLFDIEFIMKEIEDQRV
ncbi:P-loop NTPase fold protein [Paenibacillus sp. FSL H7-0350]|uniref:KAP family P-loop NTPase fold protein n=1 Tax=Paenibacillus sp. FSL H7-0350 TaxID=2975345 RepID=UPI003158E949